MKTYRPGNVKSDEKAAAPKAVVKPAAAPAKAPAAAAAVPANPALHTALHTAQPANNEPHGVKAVPTPPARPPHNVAEDSHS